MAGAVFVTLSMLILLIPHSTKRTDPTGGVMLPMHMLKMSMAPNWMLDIPRLSAIGRKIGVKIKIAGVMSMNMPTIKRMMPLVHALFTRMSMKDLKVMFLWQIERIRL